MQHIRNEAMLQMYIQHAIENGKKLEYEHEEFEGQKRVKSVTATGGAAFLLDWQNAPTESDYEDYIMAEDDLEIDKTLLLLLKRFYGVGIVTSRKVVNKDGEIISAMNFMHVGITAGQMEDLAMAMAKANER